MTDVVGVNEIAQMAGLSPQAISNRRARDASFPRPIAELAQGPIFMRSEVEAYLSGQGQAALLKASPTALPGTVRLITQPLATERLGDVLNRNLSDDRWTDLKGAVAFVKASGVRHIAAALSNFAGRATVSLSVGVDHGGTSVEGLEMLLTALGGRGTVNVCHNEAGNTFHPKTYLFSNATSALAIIGSGNLTEGGLYTNYEAGLLVELNLSRTDEKRFHDDIAGMMGAWRSASGTSIELTAATLTQLVQQGYVPREADNPPRKGANATQSGGTTSGLFGAVAVPKAPPVPSRGRQAAATKVGPAVPANTTASGRYSSFVMKVQQTDAGVGQTTRGAARRSPEIFIPLAARSADPAFWGWDTLFTADHSRPGKFDRKGVKIWFNGRVIEVNMMTWPIKHDFRIRSEELRSSLAVNDILKLEKAAPGSLYDYAAEVVKPGRPEYLRSERMCVNKVRNSGKTWGYF